MWDSPGVEVSWPIAILFRSWDLSFYMCEMSAGLSSSFPSCKEPGVLKHKFIYIIATVPFQLFKCDRKLRRYKKNIS